MVGGFLAVQKVLAAGVVAAAAGFIVWGTQSDRPEIVPPGTEALEAPAPEAAPAERAAAPTGVEAPEPATGTAKEAAAVPQPDRDTATPANYNSVRIRTVSRQLSPTALNFHHA